MWGQCGTQGCTLVWRTQAISKKQRYLPRLATFVPCGCLADSVISLDKAGQDKIFIPLMSSPWQAPQAPTRWCKACCKPQSKYTPWPVLCFGRCITSQLLHHILATASHLASRITHRALHHALRVAPHFPHRASRLISCTARCTSFPALHVTPRFPHCTSHVAPRFPHRTSLPASHLTSCVAPRLLVLCLTSLCHTSSPCVATAPSCSSSTAPASEKTCNCRPLRVQELINVSWC